MKKVFIVFILLIITPKVYCQFFNEINPISGITISAMEFETYKRFQYDLFKGIINGINVKYFEHKYWDLNSCIYFNQRGGSRKGAATSIEGETVKQKYSFILNYLSFNTTFRYKINSRIITPSVFIGPRLDCNISSTLFDINHKYKIKYGIDVGAGIEKSLNNKILLKLNGGYNYSLDNNEVSDFGNITTKTILKYSYYITIGLGIKL